MGCGSSTQTKVVPFKPSPEPSRKEILKKESRDTKPIISNKPTSPNVVTKQTQEPAQEVTKEASKEAIHTHNETNGPTKDEDIKLPPEKEQQAYAPASFIEVLEKNSTVDGTPIITQNDKPIKQLDFDRKLCRISSTTKPTRPVDKLTVIHFNDVYNIEARDQEPVGGAARFVTKVRSFPDEPLILFSGDCLNPSLSKNLFIFIYDSLQ